MLGEVGGVRECEECMGWEVGEDWVEEFWGKREGGHCEVGVVCEVVASRRSALSCVCV